MNRVLFPIEEKINKKDIEAVYKSFYDFRRKARKQRLELLGYDVNRVLELEMEILSGLKKHTASMMNVCAEGAAGYAKVLDSMKTAAVDLRNGSTRHVSLERWDVPEYVEVFDPLGLKTYTVGAVTFWGYLKTLDQCKNGRCDVEKGPLDAGNLSQAAYEGDCLARGEAEVSGSIEDGGEHSITVTMMHDFEFTAENADKYRFTPEYNINAIVSLSGSADIEDFNNSARISLKLELENGRTSRKDVFIKRDQELFVSNVYCNKYFAEPPNIVMTLEQWESVTVTVACEISVTAKNTALAEIDLGSTDELSFSAPLLKVDYEKQTVPLVHAPEPVIVTVAPEWIYKKPPEVPPIDGFRFSI